MAACSGKWLLVVNGGVDGPVELGLVGWITGICARLRLGLLLLGLVRLRVFAMC